MSYSSPFTTVSILRAQVELHVARDLSSRAVPASSLEEEAKLDTRD